MELEQPEIQDSAPDQQEAETPEILDETDQPSETESEGADQQPPEDDEIEDEIEGAKVRGKKDVVERLKAERLMQADYTRKTQEVAEQRKALEAEKQHHQQLSQHHLREVAQVIAIDERLAQLQQVNWNQLSDSDPVLAQKLWIENQQLQANKGQLLGNLAQRQQQAKLDEERRIATLKQEAAAVVAREIKGWGPELDVKLRENALRLGFPEEVLANVTSPAFVKMAHESYLYHQLMQQRSKPSAPVTPVKPVTRVGGGGATNTKRLSDMSDAEFAKARRDYIAKHRR